MTGSFITSLVIGHKNSSGTPTSKNRHFFYNKYQNIIVLQFFYCTILDMSIYNNMCKITLLVYLSLIYSFRLPPFCNFKLFLLMFCFLVTMARCTRYNGMWFFIKFVSDFDMSVVFSRYSSFLQRYNWNIVESCVKHHNPLTKPVLLIILHLGNKILFTTK